MKILSTLNHNKLLNRRYYLTMSLFGLIILSCFYLVKSFGFPIHDFSNYYYGGNLFLHGWFDKEVYDPSYFNAIVVENGLHNHFVNFAPNSPFLALFFAPLAFLDITNAKLLFNLISVACFLLSFRRVVKHLQIENHLGILLIPTIFFTPIRNGILFGQPYLLIFSLIIEGFLLYERKKAFAAVTMWAVVTALKFSPGVLVLYLFAKRDYRSVGYFIIIGVLILVLTFSTTDWDILAFFISNISPKTSFGEIVSVGFYFPNQSLLMFFKYLFVADKLENPYPLLASVPFFVLTISISYAFILTNTFQNNFRNQRSYHRFAIWFLLIFLISPYGSSYARILVLIYFLVVIQSSDIKRQILVGAILLMLCNFPYITLKDFSLFLKFPGLYGLLLIFLLEVKWPEKLKLNLLLGSLLTFVFIVYFVAVTDKRMASGEYFLDHKQSLILDFSITNEKLIYSYWNGENNRAEVPFRSNKVEPKKVKVVEGQLFLNGRQLTESFDNKKQPVLVDNNKVIYLSDWGRGYGFYTLRVLNL